VQWAAWSGIDRGDRAGVQAGDIIIWLGHMGIAVDNTHMISALNPKDKTMVTVIDDFGSKPLVFGRLNGGILS
jgi:hypothetical protein